jgi:uncharacterized HhH-GPD family protein
MQSLPFTDSDAANRLLAKEPLALLIGMLLDQQISMEKAFRGPHELQERLGGALDATAIADHDPDEFVEVFRMKPALHRFPGSMAKRTQALCRHLADEYDGDASLIWKDVTTAADLLERLSALPGFGEAKSRILIAVLGRHLGIEPDGWEAAQADFPSIADVTDFADMPAVREKKRAWKARTS